MSSKIVNASKLNVRSTPNGALQGSLKVGTAVEVLATKGNWSQIQSKAWVLDKYLSEGKTPPGKLIKRIVVHCSATKPNYNATVDDIRRWHTDPKDKGGRGWSKAGYHWVIERKPCKVMTLVPMNDNAVLEPSEISNGVRGYNNDSIHVCYVGGLNAQGRPANNMTPKQKKELIALLKTLVKDRPRLQHIVGHNDLSAMKACPSFNVGAFLRANFPRKFAAKYAIR